MTTLEPRPTRSDAEGCGAVLADLRAQAEAMRDALAAIDEATGEWDVVIEGNVIRSTRRGQSISILENAVDDWRNQWPPRP